MNKGYTISYFPPCGADAIATCAASLEIARMRAASWIAVDCDGPESPSHMAAVETSLGGVHHVEYV